jgi:hypothetical protein
MLDDGAMSPVAIDAGQTGLVLATAEPAGDAQLWHSADGLTWQRVLDLPAGSEVGGVTADAKGWVAYGTDAAGAPVFWISTNGREWKPVADSKLKPFKGALVERIVAASTGLFAFGRSKGGAANDRIWTSTNGRRWRERSEFAEAHQGSSLTAAGTMGNKFLTFGRARTGRPAVWIGSDDTINYITRQWRGSEPSRTAPPSELHVGRDGAIAVVRNIGSTQPLLWQSINAGDWRRREVPMPDAAAYASDGELIIADGITDSGAHGFSVSTDGETWRAVPSQGALPDTTTPVLLAARPSELVVAGSDGIWRATWLDRSAALPPRPTYPAPEIGPFGADPPLRAPVTRPKGSRTTLSTSRPPSASSQRGGVRLELWLPRVAVHTRDWLPAHVRLTNGGSRTITFACGGDSTRAETAKLFPKGQRWSGNAGEFKRRALDQWPGDLGFGYRQGDGDDCPGGVGLDIKLRPGENYEFDLWAIPRYPVRDQPLPSGRLPVATSFKYWVAGNDADRTITARGRIRLIGPRWRWATPQELIDAMLEDPRFKDWIDRRDRPIWWSNTTFHVVDKRSFYWTQLGFDGPAPDGTVHIGLFAGSWASFDDGYGRMLLDPWTGQVLGFAS